MSDTPLYNAELIEEMQNFDISSDLHTILDFLRWTYSTLNRAEIYFGHGYDNSWDEAQQLILSCLQLPHDVPESLLQSRLTTTEKSRLIEAVYLRIAERKPIAYITNTAWFCDLEFYVDERVIVPRSPIGELIKNGFTGFLRQQPTRIMDLCTGSGCIAIACANRFPEAEIDAIDISLDALQVTEINIYRYQLEDQVIPIASDLFENAPQDQYDLIVSNPPYVDAEDMFDAPSEFNHEPALALEAGKDGLVLVKRILAQAPNYLKDNGVLICEVGNSMVHLTEQYPNVPFNWIHFENGGLGVFSITKEELLAHQNELRAYK